MRRPPVSGGMIRPRTMGVRPTAHVEPPPSAGSATKRKQVILLVVSLFLMYGFYANFLKSDSADSFVLAGRFSEEAPLSGGSPSSFDDHDGDEEEEEEEIPVKSSSKRKSAKVVAEDDEEDEGDSDEEEDGSGGDEEEEDESFHSSKNDEEEDEPAPVKHSQSSSLRKPPRNPAHTVQSYFSNFGGNVVSIDKEGSFKYVLVRMEDSMGASALLVRGCLHSEGTHCKHHLAFARAKAELELRGFAAKVRGGGRITRHPSRHKSGQKEGYVSVFGYSKTYGACEECNKITCTLIKAAFPDHGVKWSNEGYLESDERKISDSAWTRC